MNFLVLKSSFDGICNAGKFTQIEEVIREVYYSKGWDSIEELHKAIKKWTIKSQAGEVFCTSTTAIIKINWNSNDGNSDECPYCQSSDLDYGDLDPIEGGDFQQRVLCSKCGKKWMDVFALTERRGLK